MPLFHACSPSLQGLLDEATAASAMRGVLEALAACHAADCCYGDVKPANFMLTKLYPSLTHRINPAAPKGEIHVKAIDFGCAQYCPDGCQLIQGLSGTPGECMCMHARGRGVCACGGGGNKACSGSLRCVGSGVGDCGCAEGHSCCLAGETGRGGGVARGIRLGLAGCVVVDGRAEYAATQEAGTGGWCCQATLRIAGRGTSSVVKSVMRSTVA